MQIRLDYPEVMLIEAALANYREVAESNPAIRERLANLLKRFEYFVITAEAD